MKGKEQMVGVSGEKLKNGKRVPVSQVLRRDRLVFEKKIQKREGKT